MMSLVIDADGHVEENLAELVGAIPEAMQAHAMCFVSVAGGLFESMARRELRRDPTILDRATEHEGERAWTGTVESRW